MSYQRDREDFIARMTQEGLPLHVTRLLLREATGLNRRAELACSSEAADRDRVPCPAATMKPYRLRNGAHTMTGNEYQMHGHWYRDIPTKPYGPCLCDDYTPDMHAAVQHNAVPRIAVQDWRAEERIRKALAGVNGHTPDRSWLFTTAGDPRGYVLRVIPPSYAERNAGRDRHNLESIGVPNGPSGLRF